MKVLYVMPFKICANKWFATGDTNQASQILSKITRFPNITVDVVGNFMDEDGNSYIKFVQDNYGVNNCIDLSIISSKRTYIKSGFEILKNMNIFNEYDLINIHNSNPSIVSKILTYLPDNNVVFTLHAPPENMTFQFYHREQYLQFLNDPTKLLLCVSKSHAERCLNALNYYKDYPDGNPNIKYIVNGITTELYSNDRVYDCGTIGRFSPSKNVYESLRCVAEITRYTGGKGFYVGTGSNYEESSESQKRYVDSIMELLQNNPQIDWFESLPSNEIRALLSRSKTYLSLSTIETFGLTVCEALMQGTPSIGFDTNGIGEIIEEGITGYKFSIHKSKWDLRYLESIDLYNKCLELNNDIIRSRALTRFDIDRVSKEYYDLYSGRLNNEVD